MKANKKVALVATLALAALCVGFYLYQSRSYEETDAEALALISDAKLHQEITQTPGWLPYKFFKLNLDEDADEEIFASYYVSMSALGGQAVSDKKSEEYGLSKMAFAVYKNKDSEWKDIAFMDFLAPDISLPEFKDLINLSIRKEGGKKVLYSHFKRGTSEDVQSVVLEKVTHADYIRATGYEWEIEAGI